jgi:hypothetical protein
MWTGEVSRAADYRKGQMRGRAAGIRWAVTWLHRRALQMNDPHAKTVLNVAASDMSWAHRDPVAWQKFCSNTEAAPKDCAGKLADV